MRIEIDLTKEPEYEFFNKDQLSKKMKEELKLYVPRSSVSKSKRPMTASVNSPNGNTRNIRRFSETQGELEFKGSRKVEVIEDHGALKIVKTARKNNLRGIPFDRFNEELTTIDPIASKAMSNMSLAS
jgi:hypothetical protein